MEGVESMEKIQVRFSWMTQAMPGVGKIVAGYRIKFGDAPVDECVRRGLRGEAGYFFAREGAVAVGVPAGGWTLPQWMEAYLPTATMVWLRDPEVKNGEN